MTGVIATLPQFQFSSSTGVPLALGTLTVYLATTTTPTDTWQDSALSILNTNPVQLDSSGSCTLWLDSTKSYKFVLKNAAGATQWTQDNIYGTHTQTIDNFTGNGVLTAFTLSSGVGNENNTQIYINGVYQQKNTFSLAGAVLIFSEAPPLNTTIEVTYF